MNSHSKKITSCPVLFFGSEVSREANKQHGKRTRKRQASNYNTGTSLSLRQLAGSLCREARLGNTIILRERLVLILVLTVVRNTTATAAGGTTARFVGSQNAEENRWRVLLYIERNHRLLLAD